MKVSETFTTHRIVAIRSNMWQVGFSMDSSSKIVELIAASNNLLSLVILLRPPLVASESGAGASE